MSDSLLMLLEMMEEVLGEELLAKNGQDMFDASRNDRRGDIPFDEKYNPCCSV